MSVKMLSMVWEHSAHSGNDLLMLLAIADYADDEGVAYPAVPSLAKKCRMLPRSANKVIAELRKGGELEIRTNEGPKGTNLYRIVLPLSKRTSPRPNGHPVRMDTPSKRTVCPNGDIPPVHLDPKPLSIWTDEPSVNRQEPCLPPAEVVAGHADDRCPHQAIIDLYHELLPASPPVKVWNETRQAKLRARWREDPKRQTLDWWKRFFGYVAQSDFLTGRVCSANRSPFVPNLEWLVTPNNFVKIVEGNYHDAANGPRNGGREGGPR